MHVLSVDANEAVLQDIRARAVDGSQSMPFGGLEVGGVLFGVRQGGRVSVQAWRPIPCEHSLGPGLILSSNDEAALDAILRSAATDETLGGLTPVGWFRSRRRQSNALSPDDVALHNRHFPERWHVLLVLKPRVFGATRVGIFRRDAEGVLRSDVPYEEFDINPPGATGQRIAERSAFAGPSVPAADPATRELEVRPDERITRWNEESEHIPSWAAIKPKRRIPRWAWTVLALVVAGGAGAAGTVYWRAHPDAEPPETVSLVINEEPDKLEISWNGASTVFNDAADAELEITDGERSSLVPLSSSALRAGKAIYAAHANEVLVRLTAARPNRPPLEISTRYIGRGSSRVPDAESMQALVEQLTRERDELQARMSRMTDRAMFAERELRRMQGLEPAPDAALTKPPLTAPARP